MITIAADPKHLGARIGVLSVLHTWGSALNHHPHVHMIVPGGGISLDGARWVACRPDFLLYVGVLSRLFCRLVLERLTAAHSAGALQFFGTHAALANARAFAAYLAPLRNSKWVVYCKRPFGGPEEVLRYLARYTHRVAISNRRLVALDDKRVTFKWKDYRLQGPERYNRLMTLDTHEFIRRFLMHSLPPRRRGSSPQASTASATTASSPAKPAPAISHASANCSQCPSSQSMPSRRPTPSPRNQKHQSILARAVEAACASSRSSCAGSSQGTTPHRSRQRSGSTHRDDAIIARQHQLRSLLPPTASMRVSPHRIAA
jgi:Putative transposase